MNLVWHDLRNNQDDLPNEFEHILVCTKHMLYSGKICTSYVELGYLDSLNRDNWVAWSYYDRNVDESWNYFPNNKPENNKYFILMKRTSKGTEYFDSAINSISSDCSNVKCINGVTITPIAWKYFEEFKL